MLDKERIYDTLTNKPAIGVIMLGISLVDKVELAKEVKDDKRLALIGDLKRLFIHIIEHRIREERINRCLDYLETEDPFEQ
jgi:hypothetical protein